MSPLKAQNNSDYKHYIHRKNQTGVKGLFFWVCSYLMIYDSYYGTENYLYHNRHGLKVMCLLSNFSWNFDITPAFKYPQYWQKDCYDEKCKSSNNNPPRGLYGWLIKLFHFLAYNDILNLLKRLRFTLFFLLKVIHRKDHTH